MSEDLLDIFENKKLLKKSDLKNTERKLEDDIISLINNKEFDFIKPYLKNKGSDLYLLITNYIKHIGVSKAKTDPNLTMMAPILASMKSVLDK